METLLELCRQTAVSGHEFTFGAYLKQYLDGFCDKTETDPLGNVIGVIHAGKPKKILLEAHIDQIGLIVKSIEPEGFIRFAAVGGVDAAILPACEVYIHGKETIVGVIGAKPPHLQTADESKKNYKLTDLFIDTGYTHAELIKLVSIGDIISFKTQPTQLKGDNFTSKSIDNRMGVYVVLECLKRLKAKNIGAEVIGLCSVQEEVGCRGAKVGAYRIEPDCAIVVDVTHGISPYIDETEGFPLKSGVAIGVGPNLHPGLTQKFIDCTKSHNIPYTIEVCAGNSGTDAWPIQIAGKGIPCILASVPIRYMHTSVETANMQDIDAAISAICAMIESGEMTC